jgi:hypothetical protein
MSHNKRNILELRKLFAVKRWMFSLQRAQGLLPELGSPMPFIEA